MRVLVGVVDFNPGVKDYALGKLYENLHKCVEPYADIVFVSDRQHDTFYSTLHRMPYRSFYSDDATKLGREVIRDIAEKGNYDGFIWQGSDCYYAGRDDFKRLLDNARNNKDYLALGALTSARSDEYYAVARRFITYNSNFNISRVAQSQVDIPGWELKSGEIVPAGFPGADALLVKKELFKESWEDWNYVAWYEAEKMAEIDDHLCVEEFWCWKIIKKYGDVIGLDTSIRTWHAHEIDNMARRWPGEKVPITELSW